jgi:DnaK suppressor protein
MNTPLSEHDLAELKRQLTRRREQLSTEIREQMHASGLDRQGEALDSDTSEEARDRGDEATTFERTALQVAQIKRDHDELAAVEAALARMAAGSYGVCEETGEAIERARLFANPAATRSLAGQTAYEKRNGFRTQGY